MPTDPLKRHAVAMTGLLILLAGVVSGCARMSPRLNRAISGSEQSYDVRKNMARLQERKGNLRQAQQLYRELHRQNPRDVEICQRLGVVCQRLGQNQDAVSYFMTGLKQKPHDSELLTDLGYALFLQNDLQGAEFALRQALKDDPDHRRATNNLAMVLGHQGQFDESYRLFKRVVNEPEANSNLAYIHVQRGEGREALNRYSRALTLDSNLTSAANALVQIAQMQRTAENFNDPNDRRYTSPPASVAQTNVPQVNTPQADAAQTDAPQTEHARTEPAQAEFSPPRVSQTELPQPESAQPEAVAQAQHESMPRTDDPLDPTNLFDELADEPLPVRDPVADEPRPGRAQLWGDQPDDGSVSQTGFQLPRPADEELKATP